MKGFTSWFLFYCAVHFSEPKSLKTNRATNTGKFWHLSDLHLDFYYDYTVSNKTKVCPSSYEAETIAAGPWGDYRCDSPWKLINSSVYAMKSIEGDPDFLLWTGDDTLHTGEENIYLGKEKVLEVISNITDLLKEVFPDTLIYPALGNHDYHPKSQMPPGPSYILNNTANFWEQWLTTEQMQTFRENGYYSGTVSSFPDLNMVVLNTNVWYSSNKVVDGEDDPGSQFEWLRTVLQDSKMKNKKAYIVGHIPPGYFELVDYKYWYYPNYNQKYVDIVKEFKDVIIGQFFGHHHTDTFRMFYSNGSPVSTLWIAPGVTPWMTTLPGAVNAANNPGIRLFYFDRDSLEPTDYEQYMLDLREANELGKANWTLEYTATEFFGVNSISGVSVDKVVKQLQDADPACNLSTAACPNNNVLQKFSLYNSVSYNTAYCDRVCQVNHVCAVREVEYDKYKECINGVTTLLPKTVWVFVCSLLVLGLSLL